MLHTTTTTVAAGAASSSGLSDAISYVIDHPELLPTGVTLTAIATAVTLGWSKIKHIVKNLEGLDNLAHPADTASSDERLAKLEGRVASIQRVVNRELNPNGGTSIRDRVIRTEVLLESLKEMLKDSK